MILTPSICPYCYKLFDDKHSFEVFKYAKMIGCPEYPKNTYPIIIEYQNERILIDGESK